MEHNDCRLWNKPIGGGVLDAPKTRLYQMGIIMDQYLKRNCCIIPGHIHIMVVIDYAKNGTSRTPSATETALFMMKWIIGEF